MQFERIFMMWTYVFIVAVLCIACIPVIREKRLRRKAASNLFYARWQLAMDKRKLRQEDHERELGELERSGSWEELAKAERAGDPEDLEDLWRKEVTAERLYLASIGKKPQYSSSRQEHLNRIDVLGAL
jgi:hypothetical protein